MVLLHCSYNLPTNQPTKPTNQPVMRVKRNSVWVFTRVHGSVTLIYSNYLLYLLHFIFIVRAPLIHSSYCVIMDCLLLIIQNEFISLWKMKVWFLLCLFLLLLMDKLNWWWCFFFLHHFHLYGRKWITIISSSFPWWSGRRKIVFIFITLLEWCN